LEIATLKFSAPLFFAFLFALYHIAGAVDCLGLGAFNGDGSLGCLLLDAPLYNLFERQGWGAPDAILASAGKKWAVGVMGTVMYAIAGLIFGLIARFSLKVLRWDWR
jgi:hypothetical protein